MSLDWIKKLVEYDDLCTFKLAPKLTQRHVCPSQYEKMRVDLAVQVGDTKIHCVACSINNVCPFA